MALPLRCMIREKGQHGGQCLPRGAPGCILPLSLDRIPQILDVASEMEFNLETTPRINCAAAGNPFPVRGSMELRKPDGTVLLVSSPPPTLTPLASQVVPQTPAPQDLP